MHQVHADTHEVLQYGHLGLRFLPGNGLALGSILGKSLRIQVVSLVPKAQRSQEGAGLDGVHNGDMQAGVQVEKPSCQFLGKGGCGLHDEANVTVRPSVAPQPGEEGAGTVLAAREGMHAHRSEFLVPP